MQVFALIGPSGTGKSHRASYLAFKYEINLIIDDGLLIHGNTVLAGKSAKREATKIGAVKRAIFYDDDHTAEVQKKIKEVEAKNILILGTSEKMIKRIAERLGLPHPEKTINIEDIASPRAIKKALEERRNNNSHVIPIPTFAIKKDFPGYLIDPLRSFWGKSNRKDNKKVIIERSIVRPLFNSMGNFFISEHVVTQITTFIAEQETGVSRVLKVELTETAVGVSLDISINIFYGINVPQVLHKVQKVVKEALEYITGFNVLSVQVTARRIELPEESEPPK